MSAVPLGTKLHPDGLLSRLATGIVLAVVLVALGLTLCLPIAPFMIAFAVLAIPISLFHYSRHGDCPRCGNKVSVRKRKGGVTCRECKTRLLIVKNRLLAT